MTMAHATRSCSCPARPSRCLILCAFAPCRMVLIGRFPDLATPKCNFTCAVSPCWIPAVAPSRAISCNSFCVSHSGWPDFFQAPGPIPAQHQAYWIVGVAAPDQLGSQFVHPIRSQQPDNYLVLPMDAVVGRQARPLRARTERRGLPTRAENIFDSHIAIFGSCQVASVKSRSENAVRCVRNPFVSSPLRWPTSERLHPAWKATNRRLAV